MMSRNAMPCTSTFILVKLVLGTVNNFIYNFIHGSLLNGRRVLLQIITCKGLPMVSKHSGSLQTTVGVSLRLVRCIAYWECQLLE